jgi:POTRA domain, FtsQ-type
MVRVVDDGARWRRAGALAVGGVGLVVLVVSITAPAFQVRRIEVSGAHRLAASQVVTSAGLVHAGSVFAVDPSAIERRLGRSAWVRSASASVVLPDVVTIRVEEWQPVATYRAANGPAYYLSDRAVALGPVIQGQGGGLLDIAGPQQSDPKAGQRALDPQLLTALVNIQRTLPRLIGQEVKVFEIDGCGNLTLVSGRGWQAQFGRMLTSEEVATLHDKVTALRSVAPDLDYNSPQLDTVNVMNPSAVAVRVKPKTPPAPAAAPAAPSAHSGPVRLPPAAATPATPAAPAAPTGPTIQVPACR